MLTELEKINIRRYCGFPVYGNGATASPPTFGYRYYQWYLILEYRLNNLALEEEEIIRTVYLEKLEAFENAIPTASENLDTDQAAVWYRNKNEVSDRVGLMNYWGNRLADFLGVKAPIQLLAGGQFRICV